MCANDNGTGAAPSARSVGQAIGPAPPAGPELLHARCLARDPLSRRAFLSAVFPYRHSSQAQWRRDGDRFRSAFRAYLALRWDLSPLLTVEIHVLPVAGRAPAGLPVSGDGGAARSTAVEEYRWVFTTWHP